MAYLVLGLLFIRKCFTTDRFGEFLKFMELECEL